MYDPDLQYDEKTWRERYMEEIYPYLRANGSEIGEKAMQGDALADVATYVARRNSLVMPDAADWYLEGRREHVDLDAPYWAEFVRELAQAVARLYREELEHERAPAGG